MNKQLSTLFLFLSFVLVTAQSTTDFITKKLNDNDISKVIPSLDSLMAKAKRNSPKLYYLEADVAYWETEEKTTKNDWLSFVSVGSSYNYGIFDNLTNQQLAGDPTGNQLLFSTEQTRYNIGATLQIPISALVNRKKQVKSAQIETEKAEFNKMVGENELVEVVITRYNNLIKEHRMFIISNAVVDAFTIQSVELEKDYKNGIISISEYTRLNQVLNDALRINESQRSAFILALRLLENSIGEKINIES
jgi:outer membrane protein TolC